MIYRHARGCPVCGNQIQTHRMRDYSYERCARCLGIWISFSVLDAMIAEMMPEDRPARWPVLDRIPAPDPRRCPDCQGEMVRAALYLIPIDYCEPRRDGVWMDKDELRQVLERVGDEEPRPPEPPTSFTSLLADFFATEG